MDRRHFLFSMRFRMILCFTLLFLMLVFVLKIVEFYGLPFSNFRGEYEMHKAEQLGTLNIVADLQKEGLLRWVEERKDDMKVLTGTSLIEYSVGSIHKTIHEELGKGREEDDELWRAAQKEKAYQDIFNLLALMQFTYGIYKKIDIVNTDTGNIVISTHRADIGTKTPEKRALDAAMNSEEAYIDLVRTPHGDEEDFSLIVAFPIKPYATQIANRKNIESMIISYVDPIDFIRPILLTGDYFGKATESVLVNQDRRLLIPLEHPLKDGTIAIPMKYKIETDPATLAAQGREGVIISEDYRGIPVLAAFRHIYISPQLSLGLIVKRDMVDAFSFLRRSRNYTLFIALIGIVTAFLFINLIASRLTYPIRLISGIAQQVERGNFTARAKISSLDEIGFLASSFNSMVDRIQNWKKDLEDEVEKRTGDLSIANEQLQISEQNQKAINQQLVQNEEELRVVNERLLKDEQKLRTEIKERRDVEKKLKKHLHELEVFYKASIGREERILELKKKIKELEDRSEKRS